MNDSNCIKFYHYGCAIALFVGGFRMFPDPWCFLYSWIGLVSLIALESMRRRNDKKI